MLLIHKETAEIYELLILDAYDPEVIYRHDPFKDMPCYGINAFTLYNPLSDGVQSASIHEMGDLFEILGFL